MNVLKTLREARAKRSYGSLKMKGLKRSPYKFKVTMLTFGESKFKKCGKKDKD